MTNLELAAGLSALADAIDIFVVSGDYKQLFLIRTLISKYAEIIKEELNDKRTID